MQLANEVNLAICAILAVLFLQSVEGSAVKREAVDLVIGLLENYDKGSTSSDLTEDLLSEANKEYMSWSSLDRVALKTEDPAVHLLIHFLFIPMSRMPQQFGLSWRAELAPILFIKRLEQNYKRFKPLYFGKKVGIRNLKSPKTDALLNALEKASDQKPLRTILVQKARQEFRAYSERLREISESDDVYSALEEFEKLKNYMNRFEVKVLRDTIFPTFMARKCSDTNGVQELVDMYKTKLQERPQEDSRFRKMFNFLTRSS